MTEGVRLQKVLASRGVAARRKAEDLIVAGRVRVGGHVVRELGTRVDPDARIEVDGVLVAPAPSRRYIALHKPAGVVSSAGGERGRASVVDLVHAGGRLYPVGRLDVDSEGLLLLTNDGEWAEHVLHPRYGHEREYDVHVVGDLTASAVERLRTGVALEEGIGRAERVAVVSREPAGGRLRVVLRMGWKRQIRRMCAAIGLRVTRLIRTRIGPIRLGKLAPREWRELSTTEVQRLAAGDAASGDGVRRGVEGPRPHKGRRDQGGWRGGQTRSAPPPSRGRTRGEPLRAID